MSTRYPHVKRLDTVDGLRARLDELGIADQVPVADEVDPAGPLAQPLTWTDGSAGTLEVANRFRSGGPPWNAEGLADAVAAPVRSVREVLDRLEDAGIVSTRANGEQPDAFQLGKPAENVHVGDVLAALRGDRGRPMANGRIAAVVDATIADLERSQRAGGARDTLESLLERCAST